MDVQDDLTYAALTSDQQDLVDLIGSDIFNILVENYGGQSIYIPLMETLKRRSRNECIKAEFDGCNYKSLAKKYRVSEVWVRKIIWREETSRDD